MIRLYSLPIQKLISCKKGQAMTEYGLIIALIAVVVIAVLLAIGGRLQTVFEAIRDALPE